MQLFMSWLSSCGNYISSQIPGWLIPPRTNIDSATIFVHHIFTSSKIAWRNLYMMMCVDVAGLTVIYCDGMRSPWNVSACVIYIWIRSRNYGCLVAWFCYQLIAKQVRKQSQFRDLTHISYPCSTWVEFVNIFPKHFRNSHILTVAMMYPKLKKYNQGTIISMLWLYHRHSDTKFVCLPPYCYHVGYISDNQENQQKLYTASN